MDVAVFAQKAQRPPSPLFYRDGKLGYTPDSLGNRVPDFSYCGYRASAEAIPDVPVRVVVGMKPGDATTRIQKALDHVASLPVDANGFRGAVLLQKGNFPVSGQLLIRASGVVLRGSGADATTIIGAGKDRETLIRVVGHDDRQLGTPLRIEEAYVPVNARSFTVNGTRGLKPGDEVLIQRPSTLKWIQLLGTDHFGGGITALGWKPGERDLYFDRRIVGIEGRQLTIDAPLTAALDSGFGGGLLIPYQWAGRIRNIGIENLSLVSAYDRNNPKDEDHRWMAVTLESVEDAWVRGLNFRYFAGSAVDVLSSACRVTVEDCKSLDPVSEIGGQRRYSFFTSGQQVLIQRCYAEGGYHDFGVGFCAPGPTAFVQCQSVRPYSFSGTIDSWSPGVLFDIVQVDGEAIRFGNREQDGNGAGWTTANSVLWNCSAARIDCYRMPGAANYSFGSWAQFNGNGYWESSNEQIQPRSLYYTQLSERLGRNTLDRAFIMPVETEASSSPPVSVALALTKKAYEPAPRLSDWIETDRKQNQPTTAVGQALSVDAIPAGKSPMRVRSAPLELVHGWLVQGATIATGRRLEVPWWNGSVQPKDLDKMKPHITRFVPGRVGTGLTDDLDSLTDRMQRTHTLAMEHNYGLWYERRRDDHERIRRMDGEVWPPFYELPFARSGRDSAWDGLSRYDLSKYNQWYWGRLKRFADLADEKGLVLVHQNYFQHNIIEAGAHYADFPWRTANNINNTGFPEPVPYAGDKRIFMAEQFYDISHAGRRKLHAAYIRQCLVNFRNNRNVIQLIGAEFTGPTHFVRFWLDVIGDWQKQHGKSGIIGLSATKDVQDSILADPKRAALVDLIDIRYWHYQADGSAYAPQGGLSLAPRQHARLLKPKKTSFEQVYRAVAEYRLRFPDKAVTYSGDSYDQFGWAVLLGGGSMPVLPALPAGFLDGLSVMKPQSLVAGQWLLAGKTGALLYANDGSKPNLSQLNGAYDFVCINPGSGKVLATGQYLGGQPWSVTSAGPVVIRFTSLSKK